MGGLSFFILGGKKKKGCLEGSYTSNKKEKRMNEHESPVEGTLFLTGLPPEDQYKQLVLLAWACLDQNYISLSHF